MAEEAQPLWLALDVSSYGELDLQLGVFYVEPTGTAEPSITIELWTGMQNESELGWVYAGAFAPVAAATTYKVLNVKDTLRYLRWRVDYYKAAAATFMIHGIGRPTRAS